MKPLKWALLASSVLAALLTTALVLSPAQTLHAQGTPIHVTHDSAIAGLPEAVTFTLSVESTAAITTVELEYGTEALTCGAGSATRAKPEFTSGKAVTLDYIWELRKSGTLPPGAHVWWRWHITDAAGNTFVTERQTFVTADMRFNWRTATNGPLTLHWYLGTQKFADDLLTSGLAGLARLADDTGVVVTQTVDVYIYGTTDELSDVVLYAPSWIGGIAYAEHNVVLIGIAPDNLDWGKDTIKHELTHVVIGHMTLNCLTNLPTWLSEGLAVYAEGELDAFSQSALDRAIRDNTLESVRALSTSFSAHPERASTAYAESYSLTAFLITTYGQQKMLAFLRTIADGNNSDAALQLVYGFDSDGLEDAWRASVGAQPRANVDATPTARPTKIPTVPPIGGVPQAPTATACPGGTCATPATTALAATARATARAATKTVAPSRTARSPQITSTPPSLDDFESTTILLPILCWSLACLCIIGLFVIGLVIWLVRRSRA